VADADLILHVADGAAPNVDDQIESVRTVLAEIGAGDLPEVLVLNKMDLLPGSERARLGRTHPGSVPASAQTLEGIEGLLEVIAGSLPRPPVDVRLLIPYGREDITAMLYREAEVLSEETEDEGTAVHARVGGRALSAVREFATATPSEARSPRVQDPPSPR
jgi:GTP-binding protein HflX